MNTGGCGKGVELGAKLQIKQEEKGKKTSEIHINVDYYIYLMCVYVTNNEEYGFYKITKRKLYLKAMF